MIFKCVLASQSETEALIEEYQAVFTKMVTARQEELVKPYLERGRPRRLNQLAVAPLRVSLLRALRRRSQQRPQLLPFAHINRFNAARKFRRAWSQLVTPKRKQVPKPPPVGNNTYSNIYFSMNPKPVQVPKRSSVAVSKCRFSLPYSSRLLLVQTYHQLFA